MALILVTPPENEIVSLAEAKLHLRVDVSDDDTLITFLIQSAREKAEDVLRRVLITQTWELYLDEFPDGDEIKIPLPPLQAINSLKYKDQDGNESTWDASNYIVDTAKEPGRVVLADGVSWPSDTLYPTSAITINFDAGYGDDSTDVPAHIRQAALLMIGEWYENRENATPQKLAEIPMAAKRLLWSRRVFG